MAVLIGSSCSGEYQHEGLWQVSASYSETASWWELTGGIRHKLCSQSMDWRHRLPNKGGFFPSGLDRHFDGPPQTCLHGLVYFGITNDVESHRIFSVLVVRVCNWTTR